MKTIPTTSTEWLSLRMILLGGAIVDVVTPWAWRHGANLPQGITIGFSAATVVFSFVTVYYALQIRKLFR